MVRAVEVRVVPANAAADLDLLNHFVRRRRGEGGGRQDHQKKLFHGLYSFCNSVVEQAEDWLKITPRLDSPDLLSRVRQLRSRLAGDKRDPEPRSGAFDAVNFNGRIVCVRNALSERQPEAVASARSRPVGLVEALK